ncbi:MAG: DUF418 domain-containing protein [Janthinobacterium lividum]
MERLDNRIEAIDALRGLALLGVLIINLDTEFRTTFFEQFAPHYITQADKLVRAVIGFLVEFKAITIFSMLFGVGLAIQAGTLARRGSVPRLLIRRLLVLLVFGLVHLLLIWNGDILTEYAIAGLVALPFILGPAKLTIAASAVALLLFLLLPSLPLHLLFPRSEWMNRHVLDARHVYGHGNLVEVLRFRIMETPWIGIYDVFIFPKTVSLILFGAWAWKSGIIRNAGANAQLLRNAGWVGLVLGLLLCWLDGAGIAGPLALPSIIAQVVDVFAPIVLAVGYSALALHYFNNLPTRLVALAAPAGRMAFSNYITQSIVLGLLFYGYGFGLLGRVGVITGVEVSLAIFVTQAVISRWWLRRHYFGPLEWLWRTGMYGRRQTWIR